jgi:cation:H+ antiporter
MNEYAALALGVVFAGVGGELFVRGTVGVARWARVSPAIVSATFAAFATSSPELSVAVTSASLGRPEISFGDALGSNVVNVALVLALAAVIAGIRSSNESVKRDFPVALAVPIVTAVLILDGVVSRLEGVLLLGLFVAWIIVVTLEALRQRQTKVTTPPQRRRWLIVLMSIVGVALLVAAGRLIVAAAEGIAADFGIDTFVVGATMVAVGTSTPELATTIIARLRGHDEVSLGTILGSNIFNGLLIVAVAAIISPIVVGRLEVAAALAFGVAALAIAYPWATGYIGRRRGIALLLLYAVYLGVVLQTHSP